MNMLRRAAITSIDSLSIAGALARFAFGAEPHTRVWEQMLRLHCSSNGFSTYLIRKAMAVIRPAPKPRAVDSLFGHFAPTDISAMADQVRRDGFVRLPGLVPGDICDAIAGGLRRSRGWSWRDDQGLHPVDDFDPASPSHPRYELPEREIWKIGPYQRIIADPVFAQLSSAYFGSAAALKEVGLWWSSATSNQPDASAAQMFHFDYDAVPVWLKFFVYLNDIGSDNGPHVFVRGSHTLGQPCAREILSRGYVRITDAEIADLYGAEAVTEMTGPKGTVFAVDTMGFHKGKMLTHGNRLLAQLEFATPLFVPTKSNPLPMPSDASPELLAARARDPQVYQRFPVAT